MGAHIEAPLNFTFKEKVSAARSPRSTILTDEQTELIEIVNYVFICSIVALLGIIANIINIIIFIKQGFTSTVNMSLFGIAISDLGCLITVQWFCICMNPLFEHSGIPFVPREVQYPTGGMFHITFSRITSWITAFVTVERCLGITVPLKVKQIITPQRTTVVLIVIYIINILAFVPEYSILDLKWKFYPDRNVTLIGMVYDENPGPAGALVFILTAILGVLSFVTVIVFTVILVIKLKQKSEWRRKATGDKENSGAISSKDKRTMKMIVMIACVLIICYTPGIIVSTVTIIEPEFNLLGYYLNLFMAVWSFPFIFQAVNASINIIFYYRMSTNYRQTFHQIFSLTKKKIVRKCLS